MLREPRAEFPSLWAAVDSIAPTIGCVPQTPLEWVKRVEVDVDVRHGVITAEAQRVKDFECESRESRLCAGSSLDRPTFHTDKTDYKSCKHF